MKLSIGTAQFGMNYGICNSKGIVDFNEIRKIIKYCNKERINSIDTAEGYGKSHNILGSLNLKNFQITSKISSIEKKNNKSFENIVISKIDKILNDLNIDRLYALLIHNTSALKGEFGLNFFNILQKLKKEKKFSKFGVSVYTKKELDLIISRYNIDIVNLPLSVANQEFFDNSYLKKLKEKKIEIQVRSIYLQGLLLSKYDNLPKKFKKNKFFLEWHKWLKKNNYNSLEVSTAFVKKIKHIDKILVGVDNFDQLKKIVKAYNKDLKIKYIKFNQSLILKKPFKW
ncbi:aldo/keto reductase [Candidatus Pelagibacter sp. HIMB1495]|uniref:aldo/keto reductase n=1 Tax=unclassified Candidatus Pelagibacter TaxID=2647897 RepID=UPI003F86D7F7